MEPSVTLPSSLISYFKSEGYENYKKIRHLTDEEGPKDPEDDPFRSSYKARELLQDLLSKVHGEREDNSLDASLKILEATIRYQLGMNYIHAEERPAGQECLEKCTQLITDDIALSRGGICVALSTYTELGILWASRYQGRDKALTSLDKVENLYHKYKHEIGQPPPSIDDILRPEEERPTDLQCEVKFEKIYTHALFYLAQVHKHLENLDLSAEYCQRTLRRQLKAKEYDPKEWAVNAAGLSQYFITRNMFREAKHCLSCANVIIDEAKLPEGLGDPSPDDDEETLAIRNAIPQKKADIARCWVKYFLALLDFSKERLYNDICELDVERQAEAIEELHLHEGDDAKEKHRMPLEVGSIEDTVRHKPATTFEESRELFLVGKRYVDVALEFFIMDGYVTDNIELMQDMSSLYKHIIFFENEKDRKCKMHKRRADLLSAVLKEINPQFYLLICRQLQFELGEIHSDMLDLKVAIANESNETPTTHAIKKINSLCRSSVVYFKMFLDTLKTAQKEFPATFESDVEHPAIIAHFYLARLHSKFISLVKAEKLRFMQQSVEYYKWIVDYVDRNPNCEPTVQKEVEICREMTVLLPKSMERFME